MHRLLKKSPTLIVLGLQLLLFFSCRTQPKPQLELQHPGPTEQQSPRAYLKFSLFHREVGGEKVVESSRLRLTFGQNLETYQPNKQIVEEIKRLRQASPQAQSLLFAKHSLQNKTLHLLPISSTSLKNSHRCYSSFFDALRNIWILEQNRTLIDTYLDTTPTKHQVLFQALICTEQSQVTSIRLGGRYCQTNQCTNNFFKFAQALGVTELDQPDQFQLTKFKDLLHKITPKRKNQAHVPANLNPRISIAEQKTSPSASPTNVQDIRDSQGIPLVSQPPFEVTDLHPDYRLFPSQTKQLQDSYNLAPYIRATLEYMVEHGNFKQLEFYSLEPGKVAIIKAGKTNTTRPPSAVVQRPRVLGEGSYGKVYEFSVRDANTRENLYAVKQINISSKNIEDSLDDSELSSLSSSTSPKQMEVHFFDYINDLDKKLRQLNGHPNVSNYLGYIIDRDKNIGSWQAYLIMDKYSVGDGEQFIEKIIDPNSKVYQTLSPYDWDQVKLNLSTDLVAGAEYIHSKGQAQLDIKPENVFLHQQGKDRPVWVHGDLDGLTKFGKPDGSIYNSLEFFNQKRWAGAKEYLPPEIFALYELNTRQRAVQTTADSPSSQAQFISEIEDFLGHSKTWGQRFPLESATVYSQGATLFSMLTRIHPGDFIKRIEAEGVIYDERYLNGFKSELTPQHSDMNLRMAKQLNQNMQQEIDSQIASPSNSPISKEIFRVIKQMTSLKAEQRPSFTEVSKQLREITSSNN